MGAVGIGNCCLLPTGNFCGFALGLGRLPQLRSFLDRAPESSPDRAHSQADCSVDRGVADPFPRIIKLVVTSFLGPVVDSLEPPGDLSFGKLFQFVAVRHRLRQLLGLLCDFILDRGQADFA